MKLAIIGYGTQGKKRSRILKKNNIPHTIIDPFYSNADFKYVEQLNKQISHAFLCTPDNIKLEIIKYLIKKNIKILVEKPLYFKSNNDYLNIKKLLKLYKNSFLYVAYNHRFEPNIVKLKKFLIKNKIGDIYSIEMYYGNGTARLWKNSLWRQKDKKGVIVDLAPHLLDTYIFLFGDLPSNSKFFTKSKFENKNLDFAKFGISNKSLSISFTTSLIDWKNKFEINIIGKKGSLHVHNLCKWGDSYFYFRKRKLPSGKPKELFSIAKKGDPTWKLEHNYFLNNNNKNKSNFDNDIKIKKYMDRLFNAKK